MKTVVAVIIAISVLIICGCSTSQRYQPVPVTSRNIQTYVEGEVKDLGNGLEVRVVKILDNAIPFELRETGMFPVAVEFINTSEELFYIGPSQFEASTCAGIRYPIGEQVAYTRIVAKYQGKADLEGLLSGLIVGGLIGYGVGYAAGEAFDVKSPSDIARFSAATGGISGGGYGVQSSRQALSQQTTNSLNTSMLAQTSLLAGGRAAGFILFDSEVNSVTFRYGKRLVTWEFRDE